MRGTPPKRYVRVVHVPLQVPCYCEDLTQPTLGNVDGSVYILWKMWCVGDVVWLVGIAQETCPRRCNMSVHFRTGGAIWIRSNSAQNWWKIAPVLGQAKSRTPSPQTLAIGCDKHVYAARNLLAGDPFQRCQLFTREMLTRKAVPQDSCTVLAKWTPSGRVLRG